MCPYVCERDRHRSAANYFCASFVKCFPMPLKGVCLPTSTMLFKLPNSFPLSNF